MSLSHYSRNARLAQINRERMKRTGVTPAGHKLWTKSEDTICRELYPDYQALRERLRGRTFSAIQARCRRLGIAKKTHVWTAREISTLRRIFPAATHDELLKAFPWATLRQIIGIAGYYGFRRQRKPYALTGHNVLDEIRSRCFMLRYSMRDLDEMCRSKRYFSNAQWHGAGWINHKAVAKAIKALDGKVRAEWSDLE